MPTFLLLSLILFAPAEPIPIHEVSIGLSLAQEQTVKPPLYPPLSLNHRERYKRLLVGFKARSEKKRAEARSDMIALGRGAIPLLIKNGGTKNETQGECILTCLLALMDAQDIKMLKSCSQSKTERLRVLAAKTMAKIKKLELKEDLGKALADSSARVRLAAALGLAYLGSPIGIKEMILKKAEDRTRAYPEITQALPHLKGKVHSSLLIPYLVSHEDPEVRMATIEIIVAIGDKKLKSVLGKALSDTHNLVQKAAVNALRALINGDPPIDNVFEMVEEANRWKKELGLKK